jgi:hypothetical protein
MNIIILIIGIVLGLLIINAALQDLFDKLTVYKNDKYAWVSFTFSIFYMFFGVFMLLFHKRLKEYRKIKYIEKEIKYYEDWEQMLKDNNLYNNKTKGDYIQYLNFKRYLKLRKLKKKI